MGMWVAVGLHTDRKWGLSGIKVEVGNMQIAYVFVIDGMWAIC